MKILFFFLFFISPFSFSQEIENFYFDFDKYELVENESQRLEEWINSNKDSKILSMEGMTDEKGTTTYNDSLSQKRIDFIVENIAGKIEFREDFKTLALGEHQLESNSDAENRKVTIYYLPKDLLFLEKEIVKSSYLKKKISKLKVVNIDEIDELKTLSLNEQIKKSNIGTFFTLKNIYFGYDSAKLFPNSKPELEKWVQLLERNRTLKIVIVGHICCVPRDDFNLSSRRAESVMKYFLYSGIERSRIDYIGYGSSKPKFNIPEKNEEERNANRRVEILILEK